MKKSKKKEKDKKNNSLDKKCLVIFFLVYIPRLSNSIVTKDLKIQKEIS